MQAVRFHGKEDVRVEDVEEPAPGPGEVKLRFDPTVLVMSETSVVGTLAYLPEGFDAVIAAMAEGRYSAEGWVAEIRPDQPAQTFGELCQGRGTKVLVRV
jgi:(R,R)-butanediol dehydrogenase/meso-butanediol dehydrogenase/diacetyl reductase